MFKAVLFLCIISFTVYSIETLSYSLSLVVWRIRQYSLTSSVFNIIALMSRFAQMFQAPLLGIMIDLSISYGTDPILSFRLILLFATLGVIFAMLLLPTFLNIFPKVVQRVAYKGSIKKGLFDDMDFSKLEGLKAHRRLPSKGMLSDIKDLFKYKYILLTNIMISGIYTIGVLSAYYAALSMPSNRLAIAGFSGSINSIASLLVILVFDPKVALITDEVYKGKREYVDLKLIVIVLILSRLLGTIVGQLIFVPASRWIIFIFKLLT